MMSTDRVTVAILAKDKAYCLPFFLMCLYNQTFPKDRTELYIRTNDNTDNTEEILREWLLEHGDKYATVRMDSSPISETLKNYGEHEWNSERFSILGAIRQESVDYAMSRGTHYFVVDCDNFIMPHVLESCFNDRHLGVVGPHLRLSREHGYANYHNVAAPCGYFQENQAYWPINNCEVRGKIEVDTLHCTYFINHSILPEVSYDDGTGRYEYAILSNTFRDKGIPQYLDNSRFQGFLFLNDQIPVPFTEYLQRYWWAEFMDMSRRTQP